MDIGPLIVLAVAPGLFWLWYFYRKDRCKPEPRVLIVQTFLLGILVTAPAAFLENAISMLLLSTSYFGIFLSASDQLLQSVVQISLVAVFAPVVEESAKFLSVERFVYRSKDFDEPIDGIVYGTAAALGFATLENIIYVFSAYSMSLSLALGTGIIRGVISVPAHALFAVMWGFALGHAKFLPARRRTGVIFGGLFLAMLFHGIFNFLVITNIGFAIAVLVFIPFLWWVAGRKISTALFECEETERR
jgi:RsiW-degrading membrane proteinase PrsW (M82 family)